ncbi:MAG: phosphoglycerate kinase [Candidatus Gracilibacteria bacterium]|jgi:phosphoglycerate kinase|nr:phosphoglycerate kinase [Candidatus Gracilibacteria bacterium]
MNKIQDLKNIKHKTILLRCDFNVPFDKSGKISDESRIRRSKKTIDYLIKKEAKIILITHIGRPEGKYNRKESTKNLIKPLKKILKKQIFFSKNIIGEKVEKLKSKLKNGEILLLENLRFDEREEKNDKNFAKALTQNCDYYVNEAFSCSHRKHASTYGVAKYLKTYAGFQMLEEIKNLDIAFKKIKPSVLVLGGAKIDTKIGLIENMKDKFDFILVGGAIANTFLKAKGFETGNSLIEKDKIKIAKKIIESLKKSQTKLLLPEDLIVSTKIEENAKTQNRNENEIQNNEIALDIGKKTIQTYLKILMKAKKIVFNGPMGLFEIKKFSNGTKKILKTISENKKAIKILGGGDSIDALKKSKISTKKFTHISTGGGASLEFLEGKTLPGIKILK